MDGRPERVGRGGRDALHEDGDAQAPGRRLERVEERTDRLDVVADVGDQRDVRLESAGGPASAGGQRASIVRTFSMA